MQRGKELRRGEFFRIQGWNAAGFIFFLLIHSSLALDATEIQAFNDMRAAFTPDPWGSVVSPPVDQCDWLYITCVNDHITELSFDFPPGEEHTFLPGEFFTSFTFLNTLSFNNGTTLVGPILASMAAMPSLKTLILGCKNIVGPDAIFRYITSISIINTNMIGGEPLPRNFPNLNYISLVDVAFTRVPVLYAEYGNYTLKSIYFENIDLNGQTIPERLSDNPLQSLRLINCNLTGTIPPSLGDVKSLNLVEISGSPRLTGSIPSGWFQSSIHTLRIQGNQLNGTLPRNITSPFSELIIGGNQFSGTIPASLGNAPLILFDGSFNQFIGPIPKTMLSSTLLTRLNLKGNILSGCINSTAQISECDLSSNYFCCLPTNSPCIFEPVIECRIYTVPSENCTGEPPTLTAACQTDDDGNPIWVDNGSVNATIIVIETSLIINGNLTIVGELIVSGDSVITVTGCPFINGSLTLNLTQAEIDQLLESGTYTRELIIFDVACSNSNLDFNSITVLGDFGECNKIEVKQQNGPGLISILIVQTKSGCETVIAPVSATSLSDGAIAGIVITCGVVVAGVIATAVLVSQKKKAKNRDRAMSTRLASASVSRNIVEMRQIR